MKYACLVYHEADKLGSVPDDELAEIVGECGEWVGDLEAGSHHVFSARLQSVRNASTVQIRGGKASVTDGPFAETKEFLGGFTIIEARDLNEAIQLVSKFPGAKVGKVEVRPLMDADADLTDPLDRKIAAAIRSASHE